MKNFFIFLSIAMIATGCSTLTSLRYQTELNPESYCSQVSGGCVVIDISTPNNRTAVCEQALSGWIYRVNKFKLSQGAFRDAGRASFYPRRGSMSPWDRCYEMRPNVLHKENEYFLGSKEFYVSAGAIYGHDQQIKSSIYVTSVGDLCSEGASINTYIVGSRLPKPDPLLYNSNLMNDEFIPGGVMSPEKYLDKVVNNDSLYETTLSPNIFYSIGELADHQCDPRPANIPISIRFIEELPLKDNIRSNYQDYVFRNESYEFVELYTGELEGDMLSLRGGELNIKLGRSQFLSAVEGEQIAKRIQYEDCRNAGARQAAIGLGALAFRGWPGVIFPYLVDVPSKPILCN